MEWNTKWDAAFSVILGTWYTGFLKCLMRLIFLSKFNLITFCNVPKVSKTSIVYYHPYFSHMLRFASCHLPSEFQHRICINSDTVLSFVYIQYISMFLKVCCTFKSCKTFCDLIPSLFPEEHIISVEWHPTAMVDRLVKYVGVCNRCF